MEEKAVYQLKASASQTGNVFIFACDSVVGCGDNTRGQVSPNSASRTIGFDAPLPLPLPQGIVVVGVAVGDLHVLLWSREGKVYGQGSDALGQLGHIKSVKSKATFERLMVPLQELVFFREHGPVRQCWCLARASIFGMASERVFVTGENPGGKMLCLSERIEFHIPQLLKFFGPGEREKRLRGVQSARAFTVWLTNTGEVWASSGALPMYPLRALHGKKVKSVSVCTSKGTWNSKVVIMGVTMEDAFWTLHDWSAADPVNQKDKCMELAPDGFVEQVLGVVGSNDSALVWTKHHKYIVTVSGEHTSLTWSARWELPTPAVEACINMHGITVVADDKTVSFYDFKNLNGAQPIALPTEGGKTRPSLGGNTTNLLYWRKELHHLAASDMRRLVFFLVCCFQHRVVPFGLLPRDVLYYILSYLPLY